MKLSLTALIAAATLTAGSAFAMNSPDLEPFESGASGAVISTKGTSNFASATPQLGTVDTNYVIRGD
ncbi:MAG: hypothetical protein ACPGVK_06880 [Halocynthiibacter sp.]